MKKILTIGLFLASINSIGCSSGSNALNPNQSGAVDTITNTASANIEQSRQVLAQRKTAVAQEVAKARELLANIGEENLDPEKHLASAIADYESKMNAALVKLDEFCVATKNVGSKCSEILRMNRQDQRIASACKPLLDALKDNAAHVDPLVQSSSVSFNALLTDVNKIQDAPKFKKADAEEIIAAIKASQAWSQLTKQLESLQTESNSLATVIQSANEFLQTR